MKGTFTKKALARTALLSGATLLLGFAGSAFAAYYVQQHESIVLKDPTGAPITSMNSAGNAFSMKQTCFGAVGCHGTGAGKLGYTYNDIEKHNYHAQLGANEIKGFNPWNPDSADKFRSGAGPVGKNWVQSPGHVGSW